MPFQAGFDTRDYPGIKVMDWLKANTNLKWCGYYLAPAPNRPPSGWQGQYAALKGNWGIAPIYVGQQDPRTGNAHFQPSSKLTAAQGTADGADAAKLAAADGFPPGTYVFLDWEQGDITAPGSADYIRAWVKAVAADERASPGIYCGHGIAAQLAALVGALSPAPNVRFWCWKVPTTDRHDYTGALNNVPAPDPAGNGFAGAKMWQRDQNTDLKLPNSAPIAKLNVDLDTSSLADPGAP